MSNANLIVMKNVEKSYSYNGKHLHVLKGINLEIKTGEILAIVGPSGAGKSTLLHILGALDRPTKGKIFLDNTDITQLNDDELSYLRNQRVGFVFQFHHLLPEFTALENVLLPGLISIDNDKNKYNREDIKNKALNILQEVGLKDRIDHKPSELSGGEQQRVAIARALINDPQIILTDEPTGDLDGKNSEMVSNLVWNLSRRKKQILVVVTHNEDLAKRADRIIHLADGVIGGREEI